MGQCSWELTQPRPLSGCLAASLTRRSTADAKMKPQDIYPFSDPWEVEIVARSVAQGADGVDCLGFSRPYQSNMPQAVQSWPIDASPLVSMPGACTSRRSCSVWVDCYTLNKDAVLRAERVIKVST